jgi:predicted dehydrogenase
MATKVAVVGLGPRGREWVGEVQAHRSYELAACADVDPEARRTADLGPDVPHERRFTQLDDALDAVPCDAVIVATSIGRHTEPCEIALSRGLGVLVEKPFTLRLDEAVKLVGLAEAHAVPLLVAQTYRYTDSQRAIRRILHDGQLGRVGMVASHYYNSTSQLHPSLASIRNSVLWGHAIHHLDALSYVLGQRITGVTASSFTAPWGRLPDGASMQALLTMDGGAHAVYSATYESSGHELFRWGPQYHQRFVGERATLHVFRRWLVLRERGKRPRLLRRGPRQAGPESILLDELQHALADGETPESNGRANLQTVAAMEACLRSASEGCWVNPQELLVEAGRGASRVEPG